VSNSHTAALRALAREDYRLDDVRSLQVSAATVGRFRSQISTINKTLKVSYRWASLCLIGPLQDAIFTRKRVTPPGKMWIPAGNEVRAKPDAGSGQLMDCRCID